MQKSMSRRKNPQCMSIRQCTRLLNTMRLTCDMLKNREEDRDAFEREAMGWLARVTNGVYMVRLVQKNIVDHCVVVDDDRKLIYDSMGMYPMRLCVEALHVYAGAEASDVKALEVRSLVELEAQ